MQQGTVARIMDKGYGFIQREGEEKDLFFHATEVKDGAFNDLREGDAVQFEVEEDSKGARAVQVSRA
ncbi:MAG: cold-shock protein [Candidatus Ryanbacteria bacterium CG10_big_fil_rev_8_21_14_0_10_43_42]|uniref:Cold-shock protein n=1 Tax=Candidatus Ryanbacteria bacterium CG10_big_fil_rev_8_21_14_0_10_43_42 TaxID=1974864 RepID=A0A2M8KWL4_9BACT|nr:MAG: cold-shock protein [Candidatus Ryanbacteria bacterium CG10_big_fil_rev_8_21_14_0_10_43_42]